jgi:hypothetical protein
MIPFVFIFWKKQNFKDRKQINGGHRLRGARADNEGSQGSWGGANRNDQWFDCGELYDCMCAKSELYSKKEFYLMQIL